MLMQCLYIAAQQHSISVLYRSRLYRRTVVFFSAQIIFVLYGSERSVTIGAGDAPSSSSSLFLNHQLGIMGSYKRIIIAIFLVVCLVGLSAGRGDGVTRITLTPASSSSSTTPLITELYTVIGTTILIEESNKDSSQVTPTQQNVTMLTSAPDSTNGTIAPPQNVAPTTGSNKPSPAALVSRLVTTVQTVTEDSGTGTGVGDGTDDEELITTTLAESTTDGVDLKSDGVAATTGPVSEDLEEGVTIMVTEVLTSEDAIIPRDIIATTGELLTTTQDADKVPSTTEYRDITTLSEVLKSTSETLTTPEKATTVQLHMSLPPTTPERATTALLHRSLPPTTPEKATTALLHTSLPPTTPERATTALLHTSLPPTTPERATTALLHTSLPPTTPERATTALLHTSAHPTSQASSGSPSTTHVAQTGDVECHDHRNQISASDMSAEEIENIVTLHFRDISVNEWYCSYDVKFRDFLSTRLTSNTMAVDIYYISPTPYEQNSILYVSVFPKISSRKRSAMPFVPINETLEALSNLTALISALGLPASKAPNITTDLPDSVLDTLATSPSITRDTLPGDDDEDDDTTRKPPPTIGFLSNPGLFISLVVIATVSIIIIIVGLIYLLCDRRRGRSGEYITNHTPRNSDLELGFDNPVMAENDKNVSNGNHLSSIKGEMESDMIVPYDNFTQEELMNYEVEDTHL